MELLVVIAIIGVLIALLMPALASTREASRRTDCQNRLKQIGIALHNYQSARKSFPPGSEARYYDDSTPQSFYRWSALAHLTPYLEESAAYNSLDLTVPLYRSNFQIFSQNLGAVSLVLPEFLCPSDNGGRVNAAFGPTNYAACSGSGANGGTPFDADGLFYINSHIRHGQITDGLSKTVAMSESILGQKVPANMPREQADPRFVYGYVVATPMSETTCSVPVTWNTSDPRGFSWANGEFRCAMYNHYRPPNSSEFDCIGNRITFVITPETYAVYGWRTARSLHLGGANVLLADGSVHFITDHVTPTIWKALSTRAGGEADAALP